MTMTTSPFDKNHFDYSPWFFWDHSTADEQERQIGLQAEAMRLNPEITIAERCFVSEIAAVQMDRMELGSSRARTAPSTRSRSCAAR
jgi:hypothetical protein